MIRLTRAEQQTRTRSLLVQAAARLFAELGYEGTTAQNIAETAGFSKGAFYSNFKSKGEIAVAALELLRETSRERIIQAAHLHPRDETALLGAIRSAIVINNDNRTFSLLRSEVLLRAARDPEFRDVTTRFFEDWRRGDAGLVATVFDHLDKPQSANPELIADVVLCAILGAQLMTHAGVRCAPLSDIFDFLLPRLL